MEARAHLRYARIAPRKVSVVLDLIRNQDLWTRRWRFCSTPRRPPPSSF